MLSFKKLSVTFNIKVNNGDSLSFFRTFDFYKVAGHSMEPLLDEGSLILCSKNLDDLKRSDVVIFNRELDKKSEIKRIIGLPNENIEIVDGLLLINERMPEDDFSFNFPLNLSNEVNQWKLANDQYYVIGDNILDSTDSRVYGPIHESQISAKFICKIW